MSKKKISLLIHQHTVKETSSIPVLGSAIIHKVPTINVGRVTITRIMLIPDDALSASQKLHDKYPDRKIVILDNTPFDPDSETARRTNLYHAIANSSGKSDSDFLISKNLVVVKDQDGSKLDTPYNVDILSIPAVLNPRKTNDGDYLNLFDSNQVRQKVRNIIEYAMSIRTGILIIGLWGIEAAANPEHGLIQIWNDELQRFILPKNNDDSDIDKKIKNSMVVVFAIHAKDSLNIFKREIIRI
jgi:hypothetical protein